MTAFSEYVADAARVAGYDIDSPRGGGKKALAEAAGMSHASVSRMLAGQSEIHASFLPRLAEALNVPTTELLEFAGILAADQPTSRPLAAARTVSLNVRRLRRLRGWTQEEAGVRFGAIHGEVWSNAVWSAAETTGGTRQRAWTADELVSVAELFGVTVGDLLAECCSQCGGTPPAGFTCNTCGSAS